VTGPPVCATRLRRDYWWRVTGGVFVKAEAGRMIFEGRRGAATGWFEALLPMSLYEATCGMGAVGEELTTDFADGHR
jgi:hypothetical protein